MKSINTDRASKITGPVFQFLPFCQKGKLTMKVWIDTGYLLGEGGQKTSTQWRLIQDTPS